ncbi:2-oxoglutarate dehydrogenase complex dihydrolipoyllysine-residue succinyltransferase [Carnimonas nigrificans]|uniref:2-oxoglutarate dehydrogenase complex dihydrolipoyllysine-residue succinyltransferase n=1 Tax=Carnimonas nigrificans TaxID=64323 RepID=UPI00046EC1AB|nr:2-oxoglutarate dehydrogenase complex dihydrolipoyllysine-residue succinyltransferase [Carnimonas nigrificans]
MSTEIKAPSFPESVAEGTVAAWHKQPGDSVERDELIVEIETDKVVLEVVAPSAGVLSEIKVQEGDTCDSEQVLGLLGVAEEASAGVAEAVVAAEHESSAEQSRATANQAAVEGGARHEVKAPSFPESVAEGTVSTWHKKPGEQVARDELLVDIETDKVVLEVVAPADGTISEIKASEGDQVASEQVLAIFTEGAAGGASEVSVKAAPSEAQSEEEGASKLGSKWLSPAARPLVAEHNLDVEKISGSGRNGVILKEDVQKALKAGNATTSAATSAPAAAPAAASSAELPQGERPEQRVPMSRLRQTIAKRLVNAQQTAAMLTTYNEVDMSAVMGLRSQYRDVFQKKHDIKLGFMGFFVKACTEALKRFPDVNASIDGTDIVYHGYQDIGVAVSTPRGLVVPVIRDTDTLKLADVEKQIADFGKRGRDGKLGIEDMTGGTFTITNGGIFGSMLSTPILNPPQTAILGMHNIQQRPVAVDGEVVIRPMMYLALSYDHRMIDGKDAVQFLVAIKELLEDPARFLLDV